MNTGPYFEIPRKDRDHAMLVSTAIRKEVPSSTGRNEIVIPLTGITKMPTKATARFCSPSLRKKGWKEFSFEQTKGCVFLNLVAKK